uniref:Sfi1 spindle body domain-containing protein n=1 Tax=Globisporangium ultimum (strain ATCC 200006 / CBS 805.95 / DAOM BR144) TaxID=431595 RepID=K3WFS6_GLOUD
MGNPPPAESLSMIQYFTLRLWVWKLRVIFNTWRSDTRKKHAFRRNVNQRQRAQALDFAFTCFQKWVFFTELHKCLHAKSAWIAQRRARNHLRGCVDHWRACLQQVRRGNAASKNHDRKVLSQVLAAWKHALAMARAASQFHERNSRRNVVRQWRRFVALRQSADDAAQRAVSHYRSKMIVSYWRHWRAHVHYAHGIHLKISYCHRKHGRCDQKRIFEGWKRWSARNHELQQRRAQLEKRQRRRVRERAFSWWISWKESKQNTTTMVLDAVARRDARWLQQVFKHWAKYLVSSRQQDNHRIAEIHRLGKRKHWNAWRKATQVQHCIIHVLLNLHRRHVLRTCIESWDHVTQRKLLHLDLVVHARCQRVSRIMRKCWHAFSNHVSARRVQQLALIDKIRHKSHRRASTCLYAWNAFTLARQEQKQKCGRIAHVMQRGRLLRSTWSAWNIAFREVQTLHSMKRFVATLYARRGFTSWCRFWKHKQQERARIACVTMKLGLQNMRRTLVHWKALVAWNQTLQVAHGRCQSHRGMTSLTKAWGAWRHLYLLRVKQHDHVARVLDKWRHQQLQATFLTWETRWRLRRDHRRFVVMMRITKKESTTAKFFSMWKTYAKVKRTQLRAVESNYNKLVHFKAKRVLSTWHLQSQAARRTACLLKHCVAMWQQTTLNSFFRCWKAFHDMNKHMAQQQNAAYHHYCLHLQRKALKSWTTWRQTQVRQRSRALHQKRHMQRWQMANALAKLHRAAREAKQLANLHASVVLLSVRGATSASFSHWKRFVLAQHAKRACHAKAVKHMLRYRLQRHVLQWEQHVRMEKWIRQAFQNASKVSNTTLLKRNFARWVHFRANRQFRQHLQQKALVFQVFSLLPRHFKQWQRFVTARKRKKTLLRRASGLLCHQRESKAFVEWKASTTDARNTRIALATWRNQLGRRAFTQWHHVVHFRKQQRRNSERASTFHDSRARRRAFAGWRNCVRSEKLLQRVTAHWSSTTLQTCFEAWKHTRYAIKSARMLLFRMQNRVILRVFNSWKQRIHHELHQIHAIRLRFVHLLQTQSIEKYWIVWKAWTTQARRVNAKKARSTRQLGQRVLTTWRAYVARRRNMNDRAYRLTHDVHMRWKRAYWHHWRWHQRLRLAVRCMQGQAIWTKQRTLLQTIFAAWTGFVRRSRVVVQKYRAIQRETLRIVFQNGWWAFVLRKREQHAQTLALQQLHGAFLTEWLTQQIEVRMTTLSICENVMRTGVHRRLLATTWQAWTQWQDRKRQKRIAIHRLQQQIAALSAASSNHYRMQDASTSPFDCSSRATLVRWRRLLVAKSFRKWAIDAHTERVLRKSTLTALDQWQTNHLRRTFACWRVFSMTEKQQRVLLKKSIFSKTSRCWRRWRRYVANAKHANMQHTLAITRWRQRILNAYFTTWHHWRVHMQLQRRMVLQVYSVTCLRLVRALFKIWTQFAVSRRTQRIQTTIARVQYEAKVVRTSWQTWRTHTALSRYHRQQLQVNTERLQILLLCSSFRGWHQYATQTRKLTNTARLLSSRCDTKTASTAVAAWHQYVQRKLHLQHTAVTFQRLTALQKGVAALKYVMDANKHHRATSDKAKLFVSILRDHQVAHHFLRWQTLWTLGHKKRLAIRHFQQQKLLPRVWTAWIQVVALNKRNSDRLAMAANAWKHAFVRKAWRALLAHHQLAIQRRERIAQGEMHYTTKTLKAAIVLWRRETAHVQRLNATSRKLLLRWRLQAVYRCFLGWQSVMRDASERHRCHEIAKATNKNLLMLRSWGSWRKIFVVARTGKRKCMHRAWRRWLDFREEARMLTQFQHAIAVTYLRSTQTRLMAQWKQFVVDNKLRRAMTLLSVEFASTQVVKRTWLRWRRFVHQSHADKRKISAVVHRMRFYTQMKVMHAFQIYAASRKHKRRLAERAVAFHSVNLQARSFCEWKIAALTAKSHRVKLANYVHLLQHSVQRKTFLAWSDFVEKRLELRAKMTKALALKTQLCTRTVWNAWTTFAHKSRRNKLAQQYYGARSCTRSLQQWRKFVILCKVEYMLGASHKRILENGFVVWRKLVSRNRSVRAFQLKATQTLQKQQVRACFDAWKHRNRLQRRCKQILCSAANGNHLRFRFAIWSKFTARSKRLKQMLMIPLNAFSKLPVKRPTNIAGVSSPENQDASITPDVLSESYATMTNTSREGDAKNDEKPDELVSIAIALARKARFFQRFEITWDVPQTWQRWRHIFHARLFYRLRKLHVHFVVWQSWSRQRKRIRNVLTCFQGERSMSTLRTVFHGWKNVVQRVKHLQRQRLRDRELWTIVNTKMIRSERKCLKKHWKAWRGYVDEKRHLHTSLEVYHRARIVTKYWLVWTHDFLHAMRMERIQRHTQRQHMLRFLRQRTLRRLKERQEWSKRVRLVLEYFYNKTYDTRLPRTLHHWQKTVNRTQQLRQLAIGVEQRRLSDALMVWQAWKDTKQQRRTRITMMTTRKKQVQLGAIWQHWGRYVHYRQANAEIAARALRHFVHTCLQNHWYQRVYDRKTLQCLTVRVSDTHRRTKVIRFLRRWRSRSANARLRRLYHRFCLRKHMRMWRWYVQNELAYRFADFMLRVRVKAMIRAWRELTTTCICQRQLGVQFLQAHERRLVRMVWIRWDYVLHRAHRDRHARRHHQLCLRSKSLIAWYHITQDSKFRRQEQTELALRHFERSLHRRTLSAWRCAMYDQQKKRFSLLSCMVKLTSFSGRRMLEVIWHSWRRWVERERRCRVLQFTLERNLEKRAFASWQQRVAEKLKRKQQRRDAECYYTNRLVSVLFFYWQNYALAWKDITEANSKMNSALPTRHSHLRIDVATMTNDAQIDKDGSNDAGDQGEDDDFATRPSFSEAAELSIGVKKRLMVLGKWNPRQRALQPQ